MGSSLSTSWLRAQPSYTLMTEGFMSCRRHVNILLFGCICFGSVPVLYHMYYFLSYVMRIQRIKQAVNKYGGDPTHWLYGNLYSGPGPGNPEFNAFFKQKVRKFPRVYRVWISPFFPLVVLNHPDLMKIIFKSTQPKYTDYSASYTLLLPWLGDGLLVSGGDKWVRNRKLLTPAFHYDILKGYLDVYNSCADVLLSKIDNTIEDLDGGSMEVFEPVSLCTLDTILKCAFSYDIDVQRQGKKHPYVEAVVEMSHLVMQKAFNPLYRASDLIYYYMTSSGRQFRKNCQFVHKVAEEIIHERKKMLQEQADVTQRKRYLDFLDILLTARDDNGIGLTDLEIRNEADTFLFEGHDTTAAGISWTLHALAQHPDAQEKCSQEIDELLGGRRDLKWDDLGKLPYLTLCIKETLRMHPAVPFVGRQLSEEVIIEGVTLPPGTQVELNIFNLHHNPTVWGEDHDDFIPERFENGKMESMDPYAYVPFSAGPRNCIGQNFAMNEMKVIIAKILQRFRIEDDVSHDPGQIPELVMRAKYGVKLFFHHR